MDRAPPKIVVGSAQFRPEEARPVSVDGLFTLVVATRSVAERVGELRRALARVQAGGFAARVVVDDASEIGRLQAGFNAMTAGLAERERIREVFGSDRGRGGSQPAL